MNHLLTGIILQVEDPQKMMATLEFCCYFFRRWQPYFVGICGEFSGFRSRQPWSKGSQWPCSKVQGSAIGKGWSMSKNPWNPGFQNLPSLEFLPQVEFLIKLWAWFQHSWDVFLNRSPVFDLIIRWVVSLYVIDKGLYTSQVVIAGFLNHQQYHSSPIYAFSKIFLPISRGSSYLRSGLVVRLHWISQEWWIWLDYMRFQKKPVRSPEPQTLKKKQWNKGSLFLIVVSFSWVAVDDRKMIWKKKVALLFWLSRKELTSLG